MNNIWPTMAGVIWVKLQAYLLVKEDKINDVALAQIFYKESAPLPWPPSTIDLENSDIALPAELEKFLLLLITRKQTEKVSIKTSRLVESIGQDLCGAITNGH